MRPRPTRRGGAWQEAIESPLGVTTCFGVTSVSWVLILNSKPESLRKAVLLSSLGEEGAGLQGFWMIQVRQDIEMP